MARASDQNKLIANLEKDYGKGIVALGSDEARLKIDRIPTGIFPLDFQTRGGIPAEQVTILRGSEGGTKTTTAQIIVKQYLNLCADCLVGCKCKKGGKKQRSVFWLNAEDKYPQETQDALGYDRDRIMISAPETAEESIDIVKDALYDPAVGLLVIDSIAALCPKIEIEKSAEEQTVGVVAREINRMWRVIGAARKARKQKGRAPTVIVINQERMKVGVMYGDPRTMTGGEGQKFNCALMLRMGARSLKDDKERKDEPLMKVSATVVKNNFGPKDKSCEYLLAMGKVGNLNFGEADDTEFLHASAGRFGLIKRDGAKWEIMNGSGKPLVTVPKIEAVQALLEERGDIYKKLKAAMMEKLKNGAEYL